MSSDEKTDSSLTFPWGSFKIESKYEIQIIMSIHISITLNYNKQLNPNWNGWVNIEGQWKD